MATSVRVERNDSDNSGSVCSDWDRVEAKEFYRPPFADPLFQAQTVHRDNFDLNHAEVRSLLRIKTGSCPQDRGYCPQRAHYEIGLKAIRLMDQALCFLASANSIFIGHVLLTAKSPQRDHDGV